MDKNEELLIAKAQRGNLQAFEQLVKRHDTKVMRVIFNMVNDVEDARDIYQEVFIKVFQSISKFRFQSEFYSWLFRVVINTCISFRRKEKIYQYDSLGDYDENWQMVNTFDPEKQLLNKELSNQIKLGIDRLSPKQRAVFVLRHYHGHKLKEIAAILDYSEGTVKNYLFRAVQKLRESLQKYQQI